MNKILLLGGSAQQIVAIDAAKRLGYYTVLCDYLPDNPGKNHADKFYLVSTIDKEAVLKVAREEAVCGVVAYASEPAAPTAAYVAEKLGLPGNSYESVVILSNKDKFRTFLFNNGFFSPKCLCYDDVDTALNNINQFSMPVIIKPTDSSGSKGVSVVCAKEKIRNAISFAFSFSRNHRVIIENFVEKAHSYLIGGDIFVENGKVILWGLLNCHRDNKVNPLVPVGKSYPLFLTKEDEALARQTLQALVKKIGYQNGAMNVELVIDKNKKCWILDIGPRNGGNMIPDLLEYIFGVNVAEMTINVAMGVPLNVMIGDGIPYYATHNLHTNKNGVFQGIEFSDEVEKYIVKKCIYKKQGDPVEYFDNATKAIGVVFFKFQNQDDMQRILNNINEHITIDVKQLKSYMA